MEDNLYTLALSHYQKGEYEEAFYLLKVSDKEETFSNKERVLLEACKKQISEQYYLLITNHIAQKEDIAPTDEWSIGVNSLWLYNQKNRNLSLIARSGETIIEKTYQDETRTGPINAIDIAKVLPQNKLFISGCPDGRNVESYIYDIETKKAVFLYGSFHGITENELLIVEQYKMTIDKGRCPFLVFYDLNGNCVKSLPLD